MSESLIDFNFASGFRKHFITGRRQALRKVLEREIGRREFSGPVDIDFIIDMIYGPIWYRLLNQHAPLDETFAKALTETIIRAFDPTAPQ